ncbi:hypothetical protein PR202_ga21757 [Eleusine coracana subsp. coracana]|uniref:26S proteasome non-ATPase regulatory subunit 3 N-terminal TPR repeats domain-containing protein n=1 Tax=Eleusine coracana subsp. coracana TaxID=191504 RepID=A0AAV5D1F9_ELECO|nr:hypothetical protein PR202_ga21757 [Eleusine coracana subsp. coracana]
MTADVQMKDTEPQPAAAAPAAAGAGAGSLTLHHLKEIASVSRPALSKVGPPDLPPVPPSPSRRRRLRARDRLAFLSFALPASSDATPASPPCSQDDTDMDVDAAAPASQIAIKHGLPEIEIYCYLLVLIFLIDQKKFDEIPVLLGQNRTTVEYTCAKEASCSCPEGTHISPFSGSVQQMAIIVRLLLGEIPERTVFMQK